MTTAQELISLPGPRLALITFFSALKSKAPVYYALLMKQLAAQGVDLSESANALGEVGELGWLETIGTIANIAGSVANTYASVQGVKDQAALIKEQINQLRATREAAAQALKDAAASAAAGASSAASTAVATTGNFLKSLPSWAPYAAGGVILLLLLRPRR